MLTFEATPEGPPVSALLLRPPDARALYVFAHGAGAGMRHPFMEAVSLGLAERRIATFRFHFPYMEIGRKAPDRPPVLTATVRAAVDEAARRLPGLTILAGGKSMGGRMTSLAASQEALPGVRALVFHGFPLHAAGRPSADRGAHLANVGLPMLFLQGDRDALAELELLRPLVHALGSGSTLHVEDGADHGFHVLKRSGRTDAEVVEGLCERFARWTDALLDS